MIATGILFHSKHLKSRDRIPTDLSAGKPNRIIFEIFQDLYYLLVTHVLLGGVNDSATSVPGSVTLEIAYYLFAFQGSLASSQSLIEPIFELFYYSHVALRSQFLLGRQISQTLLPFLYLSEVFPYRANQKPRHRPNESIHVTRRCNLLRDPLLNDLLFRRRNQESSSCSRFRDDIQP